MKNKLGRTPEDRMVFDLTGDPGILNQESSPDQVAIVWNEAGEAVSAIPVPSSSVAGLYDIDIARLPADQNLADALAIRRENNLDFGAFTDQTRYLTIANDFSERTRILALDGETLALDDLELFEWLINAERQMYLGTDGHPVFETPLEDTACSFTRLPNGQVALTEASRDCISRTRGKMRSVFGDRAITPLNLQIETPLRCAARYFLAAVPEGFAITRPGREFELTAFLLISRSGFSYGLWSPSTGLFSEYAFLAPTGVGQRNGLKTVKGTSAGGSRRADSDDLDSYIKRAFDQLSLQLSPEKLEQLQLSEYTQVVWSAEDELADKVKQIAGGYATEIGLDFNQIAVPLDEAVSGGLLMSSFAFGEANAVGARIMPPVNLARDLMVLADKEEVDRRRIEEALIQKRRSTAIFALLAAPVIVLAMLAAITANIILGQIVFAIRDVRAEQRAGELKPALDRRMAYEANLKWYQEFIAQVSRLRKQQPVGIGMLYELDKNYPFDLDPAFFASNMKLTEEGGIEITGLARNKDAVTSFLRSLEFAGGPESGSRLFGNLTYEVQEGVARQTVPAGGTDKAPTMSGSTLPQEGPAPGIIAWTIRGNYLPMAQFIPPDPAKAPVGAPPAAPAVPAAPPANQPAP